MSFTFFCRKPAAVDVHQGNHHDFLLRYEVSVAAAAARDPRALGEFHPQILDRIADHRNLRVAWDWLANVGGDAPGPNGIRFADIDPCDIWPIVRGLSESILAGRYATGLTRKVKVPKSSGTGFRYISLLDIEDRVVHRAIVQILQPLIDPFFDERSFGGRPRRSCSHALHCAEKIVQQSGGTTWIVDDIRAAFDQVPLKRAMDVVRKWFPDNPVCQLIGQAVGSKARKGLRQGSPLSPLLMNLYLDHFLDRPWRKRFPDVPLLRYLDDIVVICPESHDPAPLYAGLVQLVRDAGLSLKGDELKGHEPKSIRYLGSGQTANWLGFEIALNNQHLVAQVPAEPTAKWSHKLREALSNCHRQPNAPIRAQETIRGVFQHLGPCFPHSNRKAVYQLTTAVARQQAFEEILTWDEFDSRWQAAYGRYQKLGQQMDSTARAKTAAALGSEPEISAQGVLHRRDYGFEPGSFFVIYTGGSCAPNRTGGWAAIIYPTSRGRPRRMSGRLLKTTNNRAELIAVIKAFRRLAPTSHVVLRTDSRYVADGINAGIVRWKAQGWRAGSGSRNRPLRNANLWQKLDQQLQQHQVQAEWVPGNAGDSSNLACDKLAQRAILTAGHC
jgi:ribonuclease HI/retron-type reverse transcriptase